MKILRLDLRAYGPFRDVALDLADGREGLHVIYGPNEAGKSSALRALKHLLYGIPEQTPDNFLTPYDKLRIGATLADAQGRTLEFLRRKGRKGTLRTPDDKAELDADALSRYLGGIDRERFDAMFGIDHERLVRGGQEIADGNGHVGQLVFGAGSDLGRLRQLQKALEAECGELFKPKGENPPLNRAIAELAQARQAVEAATIRSADWVEHSDRLAAARRDKDAIDADLAARQRARARLDRIRQALPDVARRRELVEQLKEWAGVPRLRDGFAAERRQAAEELRAAERADAAAGAELGEIAAELEQFVEPGPLLAEAAAIEALLRRLGAHQKELKDVARLRAEHQAHRAQARDLLVELGFGDADDAAVEALRLTSPQRNRAQHLMGERHAVVKDCEATAASVDTLIRKRDAATDGLVELDEPRDVEPLRQAIRRAERKGDLVEQHEAARQEVARLERQARAALRKLAPWSGTLDEVDGLPVPPLPHVDRADAEIEAARAALAAAEQARAAAEAQLADLDRQVEQQRLEQDVPDEADLDAARARRDRGWQLVRRQWRDADAPADALRDFAGDADLADAFEQSLAHADGLADRLRREAGRVAAKARLTADRRDAAARLELARAAVEAARTGFESVESRWAALWQPAGIDPLPPRAMRAWHAEHESLKGRVEAIRDARTRADALAEEVADRRRQLGELLRALGEPDPRPGEPLGDRLDRASGVVKRAEKMAARRQALEQQRSTIEGELDAARRGDEEARASFAKWKSAWADCMAALRLPPDASPNEAQAILEQNKLLFTALDSARHHKQRIDAFEAERAELEADVARLVERIAPDLEGAPLDRAIESLHGRLNRAREDQARRDERLKQRDRALDARRAARAAIAAGRERLAALRAEAGADESADLDAIERRAAARDAAEAERLSIDARLRNLAAGATVEAFLADAAHVDPDGIDADLAGLDERLADLMDRRGQADHAIGVEETELAKMDESARLARASEAAARTQDLLARIESGAEKYVRLRLASAVLRDAIERYRERNQGPVLRRAGALFSQLTCGSFEGLRTELNEKDEPVLRGVRPGGAGVVGTEGMSEGTCDALYLALRLASLEHVLDSSSAMPFIVDDILVNFDDSRSAAALRALAELSRRTQVLFFTHHRHLLDLAEAQLAPGVLYVHQLGG